MKNFIIILVLLATTGFRNYSFGQNPKELEVSILVENNDKWRNLTPVADGSGDYTYLWVASAEYGIGSDRSSKVALIPLDAEDITYEVFVRDKKTGLIGYKSINFSNSATGRLAAPIVYPNPAKDVANISLEDFREPTLNANQKIVKAELHSEKTGALVQQISLDKSNVKGVRFNVKNLPTGTYYVHVWINDDVHGEAIRKIVRLSVNNP